MKSLLLVVVLFSSTFEVYSQNAEPFYINNDSPFYCLEEESIFNTNYSSKISQFIYSFQELSNSGLIIGSRFESISFNFNNQSQFPFSNVKIDIVPTTLISINQLQSVNHTVFEGSNIYINQGWNEFVFSEPYEWDGENILVQVCFFNQWTEMPPSMLYYSAYDLPQLWSKSSGRVGENICDNQPSSPGNGQINKPSIILFSSFIETSRIRDWNYDEFLSDEFNSNSLDLNMWKRYVRGDEYNWGYDAFRDQNSNLYFDVLSEDNIEYKCLRIDLKKLPIAETFADWNGNNERVWEYSTAGIKSRDEIYYFDKGYAEVRVKFFDDYVNMGPNFWYVSVFDEILSSSDTDEYYSEIDVYELNTCLPNFGNNSLHHANDTFPYLTKPYKLNRGLRYSGINLHDNKFHTFGFEWSENIINFYLDRKKINSVYSLLDSNGNSIPISTMKKVAAILDVNFKDSLETSGIFPGQAYNPIANEVYPYYIDYYRVYHKTQPVIDARFSIVEIFRNSGGELSVHCVPYISSSGLWNLIQCDKYGNEIGNILESNFCSGINFTNGLELNNWYKISWTLNPGQSNETTESKITFIDLSEFAFDLPGCVDGNTSMRFKLYSNANNQNSEYIIWEADQNGNQITPALYTKYGDNVEFVDLPKESKYFVQHNVTNFGITQTSEKIIDYLKWYMLEPYFDDDTIINSNLTASFNKGLKDNNAECFHQWDLYYSDINGNLGQLAASSQWTQSCSFQINPNLFYILSHGMWNRCANWKAYARFINPNAPSSFPITDESILLACLEGCENSVLINAESIQHQMIEDQDVYIIPEFYIFPNPANESISIKIDEHTLSELTISSMDGRILKSYNNFNVTDQINVSEISAGVYIVYARSYDVVYKPVRFIKN